MEMPLANQLAMPMAPSVPPEAAAQYESMYDHLSCRPPMRRSWMPAIVVALVAFAGVAVWFFRFA
jgi:hypothetical protein